MSRLYFLWLFPLLPFVLRKIMILWGVGINGGFWNFLCYAEIFSSVFVCLAVGFLVGQSSKEDREAEFRKFRGEHMLAVQKMSSECWEKTLEVNNNAARLSSLLDASEKNVRYFQSLLEKERVRATKTASEANKESLIKVTEA